MTITYEPNLLCDCDADEQPGPHEGHPQWDRCQILITMDVTDTVPVPREEVVAFALQHSWTMRGNMFFCPACTKRTGAIAAHALGDPAWEAAVPEAWRDDIRGMVHTSLDDMRSALRIFRAAHPADEMAFLRALLAALGTEQKTKRRLIEAQLRGLEQRARKTQTNSPRQFPRSSGFQPPDTAAKSRRSLDTPIAERGKGER